MKISTTVKLALSLNFIAISGLSYAQAAPTKPTPMVEISEFLPHSDPPLVDAIELRNNTDNDINLDGWMLTDKKNLDPNNNTHTIRNTVIRKGGYLTFRIEPGAIEEFGLSAAGDSINLYTPDGVLVDRIKFDTAAHGRSYGRHTNSLGKEAIVPLETMTLDCAEKGKIASKRNSGVYVGPIVLMEIMATPQAGDHEYVEIKNISKKTVKLNTKYRGDWRLKELGFSFPLGSTLAPNGRAIIIKAEANDSPTKKALRAKYGIPKTTEVYIYTQGSISDAQEVTLQGGEKFTPNDPSSYTAEELEVLMNEVHYYTVDKADFSRPGTWPDFQSAGYPLYRKSQSSYGNEPNNWETSGQLGGSPGQ